MSRRLLPRITPLPRRRRNPTPPITAELAVSLARVLASRATDPAWSRSLAALLPPPLTDARLAAAVSALADPDLALALLSWSSSQPHHHLHDDAPAPTPLAHSALLRFLARAGRFDAAEATLRSMSPTTPTRACLGELAASYADAGMDGKAAEICARARELHGKLPDRRHCNRLLRLLVERRRWEDARKLYGEMLDEEGGADNYSTCVMVRGLCLEGRVEEGRKLIEARWGAGCIPHVVFYNVLIDGYCRRGDIGRALLLLGDMDTKGFLPTVVTYGAVINWLGRKGDMEKIGSLLGEMRVRGLSPNVQIYNTVIDALCKWQSASQAMAVLKIMFAAKNLLAEMLEQNVQPDKFVYTTLIDGFIRSENLSDARKVFEFMEEKGVYPDVVGYNAMIKGYYYSGIVKAEKKTTLLDVFKVLVSDGLDQRISTKNAIIFSLCRHNMLEKALEWKDKMANKGYSSDCITFLSLLYGFCSVGIPGNWRNILPYEFQKDEIEIILRYWSALGAWPLLGIAGGGLTARGRKGQAGRHQGHSGGQLAGAIRSSRRPSPPLLFLSRLHLVECSTKLPWEASVMILAKRPPWSSPISRSCILHATVAWIISWRRVWYSGAGDNATPPGASARLSKFFWPVREHISSIIGQALERGRSSGSVELELERLHVNLSPFVVNRVLRGVSDSETAVRFYWWAESRPGFDHTQFAIAYIVSLLFIDGNFSLLSEFLDRVRSQGVALHRSLYRMLISGYVRAGKFGSVIRTFDEMVTSGCGEFGVDYNRLIGVLVKNCCFDLVEKYYGMALDKGFCLTEFTYSRWISALCQSDRIELVEKLLADMDKFGVNEAFELALRMLSLDLELSVCIYNALISGFWRSGSIGMVKDAEDLMKKMEMSGVNPDRYSYNQMLKGLCKAHQLDKAFAFVADHMEVGGFCDIVSCNILIDAFCKARKVNSALKLFKEMGYKGIQPDAVTYGTLINGLYSVGYHNLAEETFELTLKAQIVPNVNLYNIMLHNLCKVGHLKQAQNIFFQMIQMEVSPDIITFNTLIYWLGKSSRAIEALDLFRDMRGRGVEPDSLTFRYLISGLLEEGKATLAYEVWEYMMENGIILDRDVSDRLINMLKLKNK
nr:unnamed protein product [Digitaria exilis]